MIFSPIKNKYFFISLIVFFILLAYLPFYVSGGFLGDFGDPVGQTIPNKFLLVEYIKNGIFPLWNSFTFLGFPFLADIQVGTFYFPDIIIFSIFSPLYAHNISVLLHLLFAGLGFYLFSEKVSQSRIIAFSLGLMMVLTGSFLSRIVYLNFLETISFIPWVLLLVQNKKISIPLLAIIIALMVFAGHPVALFYSFIVIFIFFLFNHFAKWKNFLLATVLGFLISSIQILPFIFLKNESVRNKLSYSQFIEGSLELRDLLMFINPYASNTNFSFDNFIYFGTFAFLCLLASIFFIKKFSKNLKKLYFTGIILFLVGILFSLGGNFPILAKILYEFPIFNIIRVPARYILFSHFGALISLLVFFIFLLGKSKKLVFGLLILIVINSVIVPSVLLDRHEILDAEKQYLTELKDIIEFNGKETFSLNSVPSYFLSSSFFVFPNRHILNFMPNIIGYNPMILKRYYEFFPVAPVGSFENPNYFMDYYEKLEFVGLKRYIFPTIDFLNERGLEDKKYVIDFLENKGWKNLGSLNNELEIWENPSIKPFVYFLNNENKIESMDFKPGEIFISMNVIDDDKLIVNQTFSAGWEMVSDKGNASKIPEVFQDIVQSYDIEAGTKKILLKYRPKEVYYGLFLSLFGFLVLLIIVLNNKMNYGKNLEKN